MNNQYIEYYTKISKTIITVTIVNLKGNQAEIRLRWKYQVIKSWNKHSYQHVQIDPLMLAISLYWNPSLDEYLWKICHEIHRSKE